MESNYSPRRQLHFDDTHDEEENCNTVDGGLNNGFDGMTGWTCTKDLSKIHSSMAIEDIPRLDMEFESEEKALEFYLVYAKKVGFGVRKSKSYSDKKGKLIGRIFCCSAEGKRSKDKRYAYVKAPRAETRFGCLAKMKINRRQSGKLGVVEFIAEHNHDMSSPNKTHMYRSHRNITSTQAVNIDMASSVGIAPKTAHDLLAKQAGGREHLGFTVEDYKNYLQAKRARATKEGDTGGVLEYLQKMQLDDPNFFYTMQVDKFEMITNIFWCDGKMKADFASFGDVVCFDTTYKTNSQGRPIAMFVGVNHHKQTCIFGAALLYDETALTFEWLFDTFSRAMMGRKPNTILTDQDAAMAKALASSWPETHHRLCIWHIYQNAAIHLSNVWSEFKSFGSDFSKCIYEFEEEEDFLNQWNHMLDKYNLHENEWLKRMFGIKENWALVYGRHMFCADMMTTQRSESMNKALKMYVNYKCNFLDFLNHFQRLLERRRYEELKSDFKSVISVPSLEYPCQLLKHAATIYTPEVYEYFKSEWCKSLDASCRDCGEIGSVHQYEITPFEKQYHHTVLYDSSSGKFDCSCKKFEFSGIFCSHIVKIFSVRNIVKIPSEYILRRWTRGAKTGYFGVQSSLFDASNADPKVALGMRYRDLCGLYVQLATKAAETEETYKMAKDALLQMLDTVDAKLAQERSVFESVNTMTNCSDQGKTNTCNESASTIKGIKTKMKITSGKRFKGSLEKTSKRRKTCAKSRNSSKSAASESPTAKNVEVTENTFSTDGCFSMQGHYTQASQSTFPNIDSVYIQHHYAQRTQQPVFNKNHNNMSSIDLNSVDSTGHQICWFGKTLQAHQPDGVQSLINSTAEQHANVINENDTTYLRVHGANLTNTSGLDFNPNVWEDGDFPW